MLLIISVTVKILEGYKLCHPLCLIWHCIGVWTRVEDDAATEWQCCTSDAEHEEQSTGSNTCSTRVITVCWTCVNAIADLCSEPSNLTGNIIIDIQRCISTVLSDCLYAFALFLPSLAILIQAHLSGITSDHKADKPCREMSDCFTVTYCVSPLLLGGTDQMSCNLWKSVIFLIHSSST